MEISEKTQEIMGLFREADDYRSQYDSKAIDFYKLYRGFRKELPKALQGRSNLHIPMTYEHVDTWRSRLLKNFFGPARPWVEFIAQPREGRQVTMANDEKARVAAALVDMQLEKNRATSLFYDWFTCLLVFPAAIASVGWRKETRTRKRKEQATLNILGLQTPLPALRVVEKEETVWDDNEIQLVDFFDFWPDPRGTDIDSCRFVFQRERVTRPELEAKLRLWQETGAGEVTEPDWEEIKTLADLNEGRYERMSAVGFGMLGTDTADEKFPLYELLHYWTDDEHRIIINRQQTIFAGDNPYWHGKNRSCAVCLSSYRTSFTAFQRWGLLNIFSMN